MLVALNMNAMDKKALNSALRNGAALIAQIWFHQSCYLVLPKIMY